MKFGVFVHKVLAAHMSALVRSCRWHGHHVWMPGQPLLPMWSCQAMHVVVDVRALCLLVYCAETGQVWQSHTVCPYM